MGVTGLREIQDAAYRLACNDTADGSSGIENSGSFSGAIALCFG